MSFFLFACNTHYPRGGAQDLIGVYSSISDKEIFATVADQIRKDRLGKDDCLHVNGFFSDGNSLSIAQHWEFRMEKQLDADSLQFCSVKETFDDLGPCGLVPMTVEHIAGNSVTRLYPTLDSEKRDIRLLW